MPDPGPIRWDDDGPRNVRRRVRLVRPLSGQSVSVVCVSTRVCGVYLHWIDGRTVPCRCPAEECPYHLPPDEGGLRWKGYAACLLTRGGAGWYAEITEDAWSGSELLQDLSAKSGLRGVQLRLTRAAGGPRKPVRVDLPNGGTPVEWAESLPRPPDVRAAIQVLWTPRPNVGRGPEKEA